MAKNSVDGDAEPVPEPVTKPVPKPVPTTHGVIACVCVLAAIETTYTPDLYIRYIHGMMYTGRDSVYTVHVTVLSTADVCC